MGKYNNTSDVLTLIVEDYTGRKILKSRTSCGDSKRIAKAIKEVIDKEGLSIFIRVLDNNDYKEIKEEKFEW